MRIALISYEFPPDTGKGGIGTYTYQLAMLLALYKFDVHVFTGTDKTSNNHKLQQVSIHRVHCKDTFDFREKVLTIFSIEQQTKAFDVIESPEIHGNALEIIKLFPFIPLIVRLHAPNYLVEHLKKKYTPFFSKLRYFFGALRRGKIDFGYWRKYNYLNDLDFKFAKKANLITVPSSSMKNWAIKNWKILDTNIIVVPNPFTPAKEFIELLINENQDKKEIIFFGRLNVLKGLVNGTIAMKKILLEFPEYHFTIIGDDGAGPKVGKTMKQWMQIKLKKVLKQVSFYDGQQYEKLPFLIANATIALLPSFFESFSYTCAEAMAAGKAVIGSRGTGMDDIIVNNFSGLLVNVEKPNDIYKALRKVILNEELRIKLSKNGRQAIIAKTTHILLIESIVGVYTNLIKK